MKPLILLTIFICCLITFSLNAEAGTKQKTAKPKAGAAQKKPVDTTMPEYLPSATAAANAPFSEAVRVGNMLYLAGQLGFLPGTRNLAPGGIAAETRQTMENIRAVLEKTWLVV